MKRLLAIAAIVATFATSANAATSEGTTEPPACYPVSVHIKVNTFGCPDVAPLNEVFRKFKTKEGVERADKKTFNRAMDELDKKDCFMFSKGSGPFDAVGANKFNDMLQIVVPWKGQHRMMWVIAEAVSMDDQKLAAECEAKDPTIVTLDHDWSTGCSEQAGIKGWDAAIGKRKRTDPDLKALMAEPDLKTFTAYLAKYDCA